MIAAPDLSRFGTALATPAGWVDLGLVLACFAAGWALDRRVEIKSSSDAGIVRVGVGGANRLFFPLVTLALLVVALAAFRRWHVSIFLSTAIPLTVALGAIRLLVYAMRKLFGTPKWLPASERFVAYSIWGIVLLQFLGVLSGLWEELDAMTLPIGSRSVSVLDLVKGSVVVVLTIAAALWLSGFVEQRLQRAESLDGNLRVVLSKFFRALLLAAGVLFALQAVGIDLTLLSVFGGALGVGIGLGLQKLASNYIAGFTILLDRSIRLGDLVTVDGRFGVVTEVTSRYVVVRNLDGVEAVVPNETLVTTTVLNHSYSSRNTRVTMPVQVSYDSDVDRALALMLEAARAEPRVLGEPNGPAAFLVRFAESGIDLELGVWIDDPENGQLGLKSSINRTILRSFHANGIAIPFPRREIRLLPSGDGAAAVAADPSIGAASIAAGAAGESAGLPR